jgi:acyl carrier protein
MSGDALSQLLTEFFDLPPGATPAAMSQSQVARWDSFAMVHLIAELQLRFKVEFEVDEIDQLRSYVEIRDALRRKGVAI